MTNTDFTSVDEYIASRPEATHKVLQKVRKAIQAAVPDAEERISYQIPAYKLPTGFVLYFAGWKSHFSIYPAQPHLVEAFKEELAPYEVNNKGPIHFCLSGPPVKRIGRIAKLRARDLAAKKAEK
ncbi:MAG: DUF1801 domain-containing protein [Acidobacteria bacterium]|nr:DUF1801 domain-containing protein [Acidobacteriota bacterium]